MAHRSLDHLDKKILRLIAEDARIPFLEVARACNVSGAAIHQRIQKLTNLGVLKGSQFIIDPERIGYETCAFIGLNLRNPEKFDDVVEALRQIPEVVECHYTTGEYDLFLKMYAYNNHHLMAIIHDKLMPLGLSKRTKTRNSLCQSVGICTGWQWRSFVCRLPPSPITPSLKASEGEFSVSVHFLINYKGCHIFLQSKYYPYLCLNILA